MSLFSANCALLPHALLLQGAVSPWVLGWQFAAGERIILQDRDVFGDLGRSEVQLVQGQQQGVAVFSEWPALRSWATSGQCWQLRCKDNIRGTALNDMGCCINMTLKHPIHACKAVAACCVACAGCAHACCSSPITCPPPVAFVMQVTAAFAQALKAK
jgi:hypothetical protein